MVNFQTQQWCRKMQTTSLLYDGMIHGTVANVICDVVIISLVYLVVDSCHQCTMKH